MFDHDGLTRAHFLHLGIRDPLDVPLAAAIRQRETGTPFSAPSEVTAILETWDVLGGVDNDLITFIGSLPIGSNESLAMPALD